MNEIPFIFQDPSSFLLLSWKSTPPIYLCRVSKAPLVFQGEFCKTLPVINLFTKAQTRSSKTNVAPLFNHSVYIQITYILIIEFNRSKDLDDTALPPPSFRFFFPSVLCLFVFPSFHLSVFLFHFSSSEMILVFLAHRYAIFLCSLDVEI